MPHGESVTAYEDSLVTVEDTCIPETRTCTNGNLSGSFLFTNCVVETESASSGTELTVKTLNSLSSGSFQLSDNTTSFLLSAFSSGTARITNLTSPAATTLSQKQQRSAFGDGPYGNSPHASGHCC